ncbi:hypothetical protein D3C73_103610 [compost metagenome]
MTTDKQPQPLSTEPVPQTTPLYQEGRYTKFYLTMLILSTIGTTLGLLGLIAIPETLNELQTNPINSITSLVQIFLILPASILALVLLWRKQILGLWIKLGTYAATILTIAVSLLAINQTIKQAVDIALKDIAADDGSRGFVVSFTTGAFYAGIIMSVVVSITFAILWWFAWKNQAAADAKNK